MANPADPLLDALAEAVGPTHVLTDPALRAQYETDWTGRWRGEARAVVRPATTGEVAAVVRTCAAQGVAIVAQGGNTGLVGGSVPRGGEIVLSLRRLDTLGPVEIASGQVTAGAGVTLTALHAHAAAAGLAFGVDLTARDSATVGGIVATNAGGIHVVRHGMTRRQVVGVEAVLADGAVVRPGMAGLTKDNTGYDLAGLLVGSEGTLGVVTAARLRLVPRPARRVAALAGVGSLADAVALLPRLRALADLEAVEVLFADGVRLVAEHAGLAPPFDPLPPVLVLVECAGAGDPAAELAAALGGVEPVAVAEDREGRERLWAWRERHTEAVNALGVPHKLDVTVAPPHLPAFADAVTQTVAARWPTARTVRFGHLADGNLHVNVVGPDPASTDVDEVVLELVLAHGGSISAEHGIGVAKRAWLPQARGGAELAAMRAIKHALDPDGILNPGVLL